MFDQLLQRPRILARHRNGPLADERRRYLAHLAEQQMALLTLQTIASYTLAVANALSLEDRPSEVITKNEIEAEGDAGPTANRDRLQCGSFSTHGGISKAMPRGG